jgi:hypothetical protein
MMMMFISSPSRVLLQGRGYCKEQWVPVVGKKGLIFVLSVWCVACTVLGAGNLPTNLRGRGSIHKVGPITHRGKVMCLHHTHNK